MDFERPFWIAPHTRDRFRERFGDCSDTALARILNVQLQPPEIPDATWMKVDKKGPALLYAILVGDVQATAVVTAPPDVDITLIPRSPDDWPVVVTVYPGRKHIAKYRKRLTKLRTQERKPFEPTWQQWEIETAKLMRWIGYTLPEIARLLDRTEKQLERKVVDGSIPKAMPRWTEEELQIACDMRFDGKTYEQIGRRIGKPPGAVKLKLMRHRRRVLENPERVAFMRILHWTRDPGKFLRHLRNTDMVAHVATLYDRLGEEDSAS